MCSRSLPQDPEEQHSAPGTCIAKLARPDCTQLCLNDLEFRGFFVQSSGQCCLISTKPQPVSCLLRNHLELHPMHAAITSSASIRAASTAAPETTLSCTHRLRLPSSALTTLLLCLSLLLPLHCFLSGVFVLLCSWSGASTALSPLHLLCSCRCAENDAHQGLAIRARTFLLV